MLYAIFTHLQYLAARLQTGVVHTGLIHAQRYAVQQNDQNRDALEPRVQSESGRRNIYIVKATNQR